MFPIIVTHIVFCLECVFTLKDKSTTSRTTVLLSVLINLSTYSYYTDIYYVDVVRWMVVSCLAFGLLALHFRNNLKDGQIYFAVLGVYIASLVVANYYSSPILMLLSGALFNIVIGFLKTDILADAVGKVDSSRLFLFTPWLYFWTLFSEENSLRILICLFAFMGIVPLLTSVIEVFALLYVKLRQLLRTTAESPTKERLVVKLVV